MKRLALLVAICCGLTAQAEVLKKKSDPANETPVAKFTEPVRLEADGVPIKTESPGYASPCWADMNNDGKSDLLVGQFAQGKIMVYKNLGDGKLASGEWLQAEGSNASVPGVW